MSWDNYRLLTEAEVCDVSPMELPSRHQIGQQVLVTFFLSAETVEGGIPDYFRLPGRIVEIRFTASRVLYSAALSIGNGLYIRYDDIHASNIEIPGSEDMSNEQCIPLDKLFDYLRKMAEAERVTLPVSNKPKLSLVAANDKPSSAKDKEN